MLFADLFDIEAIKSKKKIIHVYLTSNNSKIIADGEADVQTKWIRNTSTIS